MRVTGPIVEAGEATEHEQRAKKLRTKSDDIVDGGNIVEDDLCDNGEGDGDVLVRDNGQNFTSSHQQPD